MRIYPVSFAMQDLGNDLEQLFETLVWPLDHDIMVHYIINKIGNCIRGDMM